MELFKDKKESKDSKLDMGRGCEFCSCGGEDGGACAKVCDGCFKLHVTDWLKDYPENMPGDIFEVRFKNTRRGYYQNVNELPLKDGDIVAVEASPGHDIGIVSLSGDMVAKQMRRVGFNPQNGEFKKIYRKAKPYDIEKWQEAIALEHTTMIKARQIAAEMNLNMKIGDVEYQGDKIKAIFYYIADERVDFRELIKVFADMFRIRVEMKQIGARQEAGRIGGIGACGRELCCASWISSFLSVTTNAARTQDISLNPQKLAGQCSKLKCCLVYEYDDYMDARKEFPRVNEPLYVMDGEYYFFKSDILGRTMSFSTSPGSMAGLVALPIERVREVQKLNAKGIKPDTLEGESRSVTPEVEPGFVNVIGEDSITRFDASRKKNKKGRGGKGRGYEERAGQPQREEVAQEVEGVTANESDASAPREGQQRRRTDADRRDRNNRNNNGQRQTENREGEGERRQGQNNNNQRTGEQRNGGERRPQDGQPRRNGNNNNRLPRVPRAENEQPRQSDVETGEQRPQGQPRPPRPDNGERPQGGQRRGSNDRRPNNRNNGGPRRDGKPTDGNKNGGTPSEGGGAAQ